MTTSGRFRNFAVALALALVSVSAGIRLLGSLVPFVALTQSMRGPATTLLALRLGFFGR